VMKWNGEAISSTVDVEYFKTVVPNPSGTIFMVGLGWGNDALYCLDQPEVTLLVVVEQHQEVIDLFYENNPHLKGDTRLLILHNTYTPSVAPSFISTFDMVIDSRFEYKILS